MAFPPVWDSRFYHRSEETLTLIFALLLEWATGRPAAQLSLLLAELPTHVPQPFSGEEGRPGRASHQGELQEASGT